MILQASPSHTHTHTHLLDDSDDLQDDDDCVDEIDPLMDDLSPDDRLSPLDKLQKYFQSDDVGERLVLLSNWLRITWTPLDSFVCTKLYNSP